ncbi:MAG TPA: periplasmic heavy metal sensor [Myxococcales bacterium]|jgi:Spy/CpxP family protein refolding chaperone|nr:periplasmic heavy metal sensor [Myxococcales bacterium]
MRSQIFGIPVLLVLALQTAGAAPPEAPPDPIRDRLYPPDLIMQHQAELGIDDRQRAAMTKEVSTFQSQVVDLQWKMSSATDELARLLDSSRIDETRALAQADKVMAIEREMKKSHLTLLIRLRNLLTDAQRAQLANARRSTP